MPKPSFGSLVADALDEVKFHGRGKPHRAIYNFFFNPSFQLAWNYRWLRWADAYCKPLVPFIKIRQHRKFASQISNKAVLGRRVTFPHPLGIVIGDGCVVGANCKIYQQSTMGAKGGEVKEYPSLGDGCTLFPGSRVIGPIQLGDGCTVGANAVVTKSFPSGTVLAGVPAKPIPPKQDV